MRPAIDLLRHESRARLFLQETVPDELLGRVFGVKDAVTAWEFAAAFVAGAPLVAVLGPRGALMTAAAGAAVVAALAALALARPRMARVSARPDWG
jgi:hypothetical protein